MNEANFNTLFPESNIVLFYFTVIFCDGKQQTKHKKRIFSFYKTFVLLSNIAFVVWRIQTLKTFSFITRENANHFSYLPSWAKKYCVFASEGCSFFDSRSLSCLHPLAVQELQAYVATHFRCNLLSPL